MVLAEDAASAQACLAQQLHTGKTTARYAQRYRTGEVLARDTVLLTTVVAVPVLVIIAALLQR